MTNLNKADDSQQSSSPQPVKGMPDDFPREYELISLPGAMSKLGLVEVDGRFYPEGGTPGDVHRQYGICEDLARQGVDYCLRKIADGTVSADGAALERQYGVMLAKDWCSAEQKSWIVRRVAALRGWSVPGSAPELMRAN